MRKLSLAGAALLVLMTGPVAAQNPQGRWVWQDLGTFLGTRAAEQQEQPAPRPPSFTQLGPEPIPPGLLVSIYGKDLGPISSCTGQEDPARREPDAPEPRGFPPELCGVQVLVNEIPAGLLYVSAGQINLKFPFGTPNGTASVRVVRGGLVSNPVSVRVGPPYIEVSLAEPAYVGMPVWVKVLSRGRTAFPSYPVSVNPIELGCVDIQVRLRGELLPRIPEDPRMRPGIGGFQCGSVLPGEPVRPGQLPLHLLYRFEEAGTYEVRLASRTASIGNTPGRVLTDSAWTPMEVFPADQDQRAQWLARRGRLLPTNAVEILNDFLPGILGIPDEPSLMIVFHYLYHPEQIVRRYAMHGLGYWPEAQVQPALERLVDEQGPIYNSVGVVKRHEYTPEPRAESTAVRRFLSDRSSKTVDAANGSPYLSADEAPAFFAGLRPTCRISLRRTTQARLLRILRCTLVVTSHLFDPTPSGTMICYSNSPFSCKERQGAPPMARRTDVHHGSSGLPCM